MVETVFEGALLHNNYSWETFTVGFKCLGWERFFLHLYIDVSPYLRIMGPKNDITIVQHHKR